MIHFEEVNEENWRLNLTVAEGQSSYVAPMNAILARAYAYRNARSQAFFIYDEELPVGAVLYYDCPELDAYDLSQIFIDQRYQQRGYGKNAMRLLLDRLRMDGRYPNVVLCYIEGNNVAKQFYEGFGFIETEKDGDEIVMMLKL